MGTDLIAQDSAAAARRLANLRLRPVPRIAFLGDSLTQFGINSTTGVTQWTNVSYLNWLRWILRDRITTDPTLVFGVASTKTDHLLATQVPQVLAARPDIAIIQDGTNDIGVLTAAQSTANIAAAVAALNAAGIAVVIAGIVPQSGWSAAKRQQAAEFNRQLWLLSRDPARSVRFVDLNPIFADYGTGNAIAGYQFNDNIHDSPTGALAKAQSIAAAIDDLCPRGAELLVAPAGEAFDATLSPAGDMLTNGAMAGTGGTLASGASGVVPTGWIGGFSASGGSTMTLALSKGSDASYPTMAVSTITLGGTGDANSAKLDQAIATPAGLAAGDRLHLQCDVRWAGLSGVRSVNLRLSVSDGTTPYESYDGANFTPGGTANLTLPAAFAGLMRTPGLTLPSGFQSLRARLHVVPLAGATLGGTVSFGRCSMRKS